MSPRRHRRRVDERGASPDGQDRPHLERVEAQPDGDWVVRSVNGEAATKTYRCPGCDQEIRPATTHLVAWPADGGQRVSERRHWHTPCWRARHRRPRR